MFVFILTAPRASIFSEPLSS